TVRDLRNMIDLGRRAAPPGDDAWAPPVVRCVATTGEGVADVVEAVHAHAEWAARTGEAARRRLRRAGAEIEGIALAALRARIAGLRGGDLVPRLAEEVVARRSDPFTAARSVLADLDGA